MDTLNTNKYFLLTILLFSCLGCAQKYVPKPVILNEFDYSFTFPDKNERDVLSGKIFVIQKGVKIDSGKFVTSSSAPVTAAIKFYHGGKSVNKEDTIKINIGKEQHFITSIEEKSVDRKKGLSPFSSSSKPFIINFKIDGKQFNESETLIIK